MAHKKGASSSRNGRDSDAQRLGRQAVRRPGGQRRRDPGPPARHQVPPGRPGRPRRRRHAVRAGRRAVQFGTKRGRKTVSIVPGRAACSRRPSADSPGADPDGGPESLRARPSSCHRHEEDGGAVATFVDRVVLHAAGRRRRARLRLDPPGEVQAARRPGRRQRRPRRRRRARRRPAACTPCSTSTSARTPRPATASRRPGQQPRTARTASDLELRVPGRHRRADRRRRGARRPGRRRHPLRRRPRRPRRPGQRARWPRHAARRPASPMLGEPGEAARRRARAQERRRRRPGRLPQRRQVLADRGAVGGPAEDRRLPVHHAGAQPRRGAAPASTTFTVADVPGPDPGRGQGKGLGLEFLRHIERCAVLVHVVDCATLEPGRDPLSRHRRARGTSWPQYGGAGRTGPRLVVLNKIDVPDGARPGRDRPARPRGARLPGVRGQRGDPRRPERADVRAGRGGRGRPRRASRRRSRPGSCCGRRRSTTRGFTVERDPSDGAFVVRGAQAGALGPADRLRQRRGGRLPRRPAGPARRRGRSWPRPAPRRAPRSRSATSRFDWEPTSWPAVDVGAGRARHRRAAGDADRADRGRAAGREPDPARAASTRTPAESLDGADDSRRRRRSAAAPPTRPRRPAPVDAASGDGRPPRAAGVVVKVGSSSLTTAAGGLDPDRLDALVDALAAPAWPPAPRSCWSPPARSRPGSRRSALPRRPRDLATQQAARQRRPDAAGRAVRGVVRAGTGCTVGQVLLTADDVVRRAHYRNAQRTFERLLSLGVVPVVNENDAVATDEIRFGDNDRLAALVAHLVARRRAGPAVRCGRPLRRRPAPAGRPADRRGARRRPTSTGVRLGRTGRAGVGTGGMATKLDAAADRRPARACRCCWRAAEPVGRGAGRRAGRHRFPPPPGAPAPGCFWLRHADHPARPAGRSTHGAVAAVVRRRTSLLPAGVTGVQRRVRRRRPGRAGRPGRRGGRPRAGRLRRRRSCRSCSAGPPASSPPSTAREVVHRDDLVLLRSSPRMR